MVIFQNQFDQMVSQLTYSQIIVSSTESSLCLLPQNLSFTPRFYVEMIM